MSKDQKKYISEIIQELYLYPSRPVGENVVRCLVWITSWLIGVRGQDNIGAQALGGAYFIFSASLFLEFYPEQRRRPITKFLHRLFCALLISTALGALILILSTDTTDQAWYYSWSINLLPIAGPVFCVIMFISMILAVLDLHKFFYDAEEESKQEMERSRQAAESQFTANLMGPQKGGDTQ